MYIIDVPHSRINVDDRSIYTPTPRNQLPLSRRLNIVRSARGANGHIEWFDDSNDMFNYLGKETFNRNSKYFKPEIEHLEKNISHCGCWCVALRPPDATKASTVIWLDFEQTDVIQYQKDEFGNYLRDENGDKIPQENELKAPITEAGYKASFRSEALAADVNGKELEIITTDLGDGKSKFSVPYMVLLSTSVGEWGNKTGIKVTVDREANTLDELAVVGGVRYDIHPCEIPYGTSIFESVLTDFNRLSTPVVFADLAVDTRTDLDYAYEAKLEASYTTSKLPYEIYVYQEHLATVAGKILAVEPTLTAKGFKPEYVNVFTFVDDLGNPFDHVNVDISESNTFTFTSSYVVALEGGTDGDTSDAKFEESYLNLLNNKYPQAHILDAARKDFNLIVDTGLTLDTKKGLLDFLASRDDFMALMTTHGAMGDRQLDPAEEESIGIALEMRARLVPESLIHGTSACRAVIMGQSGKLHKGYRKPIGYNLELATKVAARHNTESMSGKFTGTPDSLVTMFKDVNYLPETLTEKHRLFKNSICYAETYEREVRFHAAIRTVYEHTSSVLLDFELVLGVIYSKQVLRKLWADNASLNWPFGKLKEKVEREANEKLTTVYKGKFGFDFTAYQTVDEQKRGNIVHGLLNIVSGGSKYIFDFDIATSRENYTPVE